MYRVTLRSHAWLELRYKLRPNTMVLHST